MRHPPLHPTVVRYTKCVIGESFNNWMEFRYTNISSNANVSSTISLENFAIFKLR